MIVKCSVLSRSGCRVRQKFLELWSKWNETIYSQWQYSLAGFFWLDGDNVFAGRKLASALGVTSPLPSSIRVRLVGLIVGDRLPDNCFDFLEPDRFLQVFDHAGPQRFLAPFRSEMSTAPHDWSLGSLRQTLQNTSRRRPFHVREAQIQ